MKPYTLSGEYTGAVNAEQYLVLWKNGSPITESPVDATSYLRGDYIGDAKVAYVGSGTSFTPRGIIANQIITSKYLPLMVQMILKIINKTVQRKVRYHH